MEFKENLKNIRKEKKISQKKLGELIGKKEITIRNYESGKITPPIKVIEDIAEKLNIPLYQLLGTNNFKENTNIIDLIEDEKKEQLLYNLFGSHVSENIQLEVFNRLNPKLNVAEEQSKKIYAKISQDILKILKDDVKEYFKIYSGKNLTAEEIKKLHEDILKYMLFLLSELKNKK